MKSLQELAAIRDRMKQTVNTRERPPTIPRAWWWAWLPAESPPVRARAERLYGRDCPPRACGRAGDADRLHWPVPV